MSFKRNLLNTAVTAVLFSIPVAGVIAQTSGSGETLQLAQVQQEGTIQGRVTDDVSGTSLQGAIVEISALNMSTTVDSEGRFTLLRVPAGTHTLAVRYIDREPQQITVTVQSNAAVA